MLKKVVSLGAAAALAGCGSASSSALNSYNDAKLESEVDARQWASSSAPNIYALANTFPLLLGLMGSLGGSEADPNCPRQTKSGNKTTVEGGCTDTSGRKWLGKMVDAREAAGSSTGKITFDGFGMERQDECNGQQVTARATYDGTVVISGTDSALDFEVDLLISGSGPDENANCAIKEGTAAIDYEGSLASDGTKQKWNGAGRIGSSELGVVRAETKDEVINNSVCSNEAASGTTTVISGSNTVVYTYDGATKCDDDSRVTWTLNGQAKGELAGVRCAAASGPALAAWGLFALWGSGLLRRRSRK
jgi:hypothetical protein